MEDMQVAYKQGIISPLSFSTPRIHVSFYYFTCYSSVTSRLPPKWRAFLQANDRAAILAPEDTFRPLCALSVVLVILHGKRSFAREA